MDRYYIEKFLASHQSDIKGRVLEIRDAEYTRRFGGTAVSQSDVLDIDPSNPHANIVADMRSSHGLPSGAYDCIILTQTLQLIDDIAAAIGQCERMLRPGGVLLATVPTTIRVDDEAGVDGDFWRLTEASARKLFAEQFPLDGLEVHAFGNVTACTAFLQGISAEELSNTELDRLDARFPLVVTIRAVKAASGEARSAHAVTREAVTAVRGRAAVVTKAGDAIVLAYHRIADLAPDTHRLCTPPEVFRAHMEYVSRCCCPMSLRDLVRAAAEGAVPDRAVVVTLDDGYLDALTTASPILERYGVPATFFVNSDRIDIEHERHWDIFERIFLGATALPPEFAVNLGEHQLRLPTVTATDRIDTLEALHRAGWALDEAARADLAAEAIAWSGVDCGPRPTHRVLTSAEVVELASRPGHSIGAHTTHHLALSTQPKAKKHQEIADDKRALEALLGSTVEWFAYPYGDFDGETVEAVREAGFTAAVTVEPGRVRGGVNRFLLPRVEVQRQDWSNFAARVGRP
ncbi:MAG TPA: polysaccharide deacetylase family protein [Vicinamibacterales bacterium]|nr:polysaccharide deacetylase family protein [Vicinamibacterales bacterium]